MHKNVFAAAMLLLLFSCSNDQQRPVKAGNKPPDLWAQYSVSAQEGDSLATCLLQYFSDPEMRQTLLLQPPAGVQVDGQVLTADSAGVVGAFYEYQAPVQEFRGTHHVRFTDLNKAVFVDSFSFYPFRLSAELPAVLSLQDHALPVDGLPEGSAVRVVLTDTSSAGQGINELVRVQEGKLLLPAYFWGSLHSGPVVLHLTAEEERPLRSNLPGSVLISYGLSRVVELRK